MPANSPDNAADGRRRSTRRSSFTAVKVVGPVAPALLLAVLVVAPLALGAVHKPALSLVVGLSLAALVALGMTSALGGLPLRGGRLALPLFALLLLPALQIIPLPLDVRSRLDSAGTVLLKNTPGGLPQSFPMSLDPPSTRQELAAAAAALAVFLVSLNLAKGRRGMSRPLLRAIALCGGVALVIGMGHGIANVNQVYGHFGPPSASRLVGPFINPNHLAQFLELTAFVALAVAIQAPSRAVRVAWSGLAGILAVGALLTLSRGAVVALAVGGSVFVVLWQIRAWRENAGAEGPSFGAVNRTRQVAMVALLGGGVIAGTALALGAGPLVDEIRQTQIDERQEKIEVWRQSLAVLRSHPAGIGRGAFNEVFPVYRATGSFLTQDFVENEILQHLIDLGWIGFGVLVVAMIFAGRRLWPRARRDTVDLALMAGLAALFVHNIFDFGWEILGIRLPVVAVAGITVGRSLRSGHHEGPSRLFGVHATAVLVLGIVGLAAHWQPAGRDFDLAIRRAPAHEKAALAQIAAQHHPVDYFYPLAQALAEPVRPGPDGRSPRLVALNRAVRLCPSCYRVQVEIARALFALGRRSQSVLQWQIAFDLQPSMTLPGLNELMRAGAQPEELAACRPQAPEAAAVVARVLVGMGVERVALQAIDWAESRGVAMLEIALLRAELAVKVARFDVAEEQLQAAQAMDPREPRLFLGLADIAQARGDLDQALGLLHEGVTVNPGHAGLAIRRVDVIVTHGLWEHLDPALLALKQAHAGNPDAALQAHILAARAYEKRGNLPRALQEYRAGANLRPDHVGVWRHLAAAAQQGGHFTVALDAYREVLRLVPGDEKAQQALTVLEDKREEIRRGRFWVPRLPTGAAR